MSTNGKLGSKRWLRAWLLAGVLAGAGVGTGCYEGYPGRPWPHGPRDPAAGPDLSGPTACVDTERFFEDAVWRPILKPRCLACHNRNGAARHTDLLLQDSDQPGYLDANFNTVANVARLEIDGESLLWLKPSARVDHGGARVLDPEGDDVAALCDLVRRLEARVQCIDDEDIAAFYEGIELLDARQTLRKAVFLLASRLPTPDEYARVDADGMAGLRAVLDGVLREEAFYVRLKEIWNDVLHTDAYRSGSDAVDTLDEARFPDAFWYEDLPADALEAAMRFTNDAIAREPLEIVEWVVRHDRSFSEILTGDFTIVTPYSARSYGIPLDVFADPDDPEARAAYTFEDLPQAGLLTTSVFLNRYPTSPTNRNRHRARMVFELFLATDVQRLAARPIDASSVGDHNPTLYDPACNVCHDLLDPVAGAFMNRDELGRYRPPDDGWFGDMRPPGFGDLEIPADEKTRALRWLGEQIVDTPQFARAVVHVMFRGLTGQEPLVEPIDPDRPDYVQRIRAFEAQNHVLEEIAAAFASSGFDLRVVVIGLVQTHWFRAVSSVPLDPVRRSELQDMGTARLLAPELLHRRIEATTGQPWRRDGVDVLLSGDAYAFFYGGIDSVSVTRRLTEMNGVMANIAERMSNEVACASTALDFARPRGERLLFSAVDPEDTPASGAEPAIRENLRHLHEHLLGERLSTSDPEIDRTYGLFTTVLQDGQAGLARGELSVALPTPCRAEVDPSTGAPLPRPVVDDPEYTVRAWMAVMSHLLGDFAYLYE